MIAVARELPVSAASAWRVFVDTRLWPEWGPTVRGATVDGGGSHIRAGCTGRVRTAVGLSLPFEVVEWDDGRRWAWSVAGVRATGHRVEPVAADRCVAVIEIPVWAPAYAPVCWVALGRIGRLAAL